MILIVGLGNPGRQFKNTPHNLGFATIDRFRKHHHLPGFTKKSKALISRGNINGQEIILAKPLTFMNESGQAVFQLVQEHQIKPEQLWLAHDDADLPLGAVKIDANRSSGGHKGVASVIEFLKTKNFSRVRLGAATAQRKDLKEFVLKSYNRNERAEARKMIEQAIIELEKDLFKKEPA
jgi:peptidyl-tRNA hydrolase, PTH1 family